MRLCRFSDAGVSRSAFYSEESLVPVAAAAGEFTRQTGQQLTLPGTDDLLPLLPGGDSRESALQLSKWLAGPGQQTAARLAMPTAQAQVLVPVPRPNKLLLLAGNYADHIREGGGIAAERAETFPYVFMKPPSTTLTDPGQPITIPAISPKAIDWELELAVVIGRRVKGLREAEALSAVAGYTVINDISNRKFRPNPQRKERPKDTFFDWLHGKWHDSFCPCGPCITSADAIPDPQQLPMHLKLNDEVRQNASTGLMIFPVAALIEFISSFVTLEPGDIISTGTPAGVGSSSGTFVKPGDTLTAHIDRIGTLVTPVRGE
ncbi:MAG TPA: 5-carboxymethyl-2-hydroxymuconate isomerase [Planctomycetaceae bacterium]|nr:5-carboxymethyl-2-hydroxymuconate isomerase [Planctomycetaceae bacterium]